MKVAGMRIDLPSNWQWSKCNDVMDVRDGTHDTPKYTQFGYPLITSKNLKPDGIDFSDVSYISEEDHRDISKRSKVDRNDILFAMIGTIGNPVIVETDEEFSVKNVALFKFAKSYIDPVFFKYLLGTPIIQRQLINETRGGTQKFVSLTVLRNMLIPYPPPEEQKRIAAILDKADRVRRKRQEAIRLTEELGRSIFLDMFGDLFAFLTGKQKHEKEFLYCKLGDQITLQRGFDLLKKDCTEGAYPVISSGGIHTYHDQYKAKGPGVLLGRKGSVGRVHYVEDDYWPHDTTLWIKNFNNNNPVFVYHFFKLFPILRFEASTASPTLNRNRLHPLQVFWPNKELQTKFANSISVINKYEDRNNSHLSQSENLFNSLLQRAFRGEL